MVDFNAQFSDAENAKGAPSVVSRDNDLKVSKPGDVEAIATTDYRGQQNDAGSGTKVVEAARIR